MHSPCGIQISFTTFLTDVVAGDSNVYIAKYANSSQVHLSLELKYSVLGKNCHDQGIVQWKFSSQPNEDDRCALTRVGLKLEVFCENKKMKTHFH